MEVRLAMREQFIHATTARRSPQLKKPSSAKLNSSDHKPLTESLPEWEGFHPQPRFSRHDHPVIGILPGEGIGPELMEAVAVVLGSVGQRTGASFDIRIGGAIGISAANACGSALSEEVTLFCEDIFADGGAILCGPGGGRFVYDLRKRLDLFCKLIPIRPLPALDDCGVLRAHARRKVDVIVVRENISGAYFGQWFRKINGDGDQEASHTFRYTADEVRRILAVGVRLAQKRRHRLALVVKPNGMPTVSELWIDLFEEMTAGRELDTRVLEVDNACYQIVAAAGEFDVVLAPNHMGDILGDVAALLLGSRGLSYSGNFGSAGLAVYQTGHGAAWDLEGRGSANPIGQISAAAMMLRESFGMFDAAAAIETAISRTLAAGIRTADVAGPGARVVGTQEMAEHIADAILQEVNTLQDA
jgi:3-isopropylmalate dehydrogenase